MAKSKNWIGKAVSKPGALRKTLGIKKGATIPTKLLTKAASGKLGKKTAQRARLAQTFKKMRGKGRG